jgi:uncharacterized membrane protein
MKPDELRKIAYQRPFQPFRVMLKTGEALHIASDLRTTVADALVVFGVDEDPTTGHARRMRIVNINDIAAVEPVLAP